jgi:hypothetical protein
MESTEPNVFEGLPTSCYRDRLAKWSGPQEQKVLACSALDAFDRSSTAGEPTSDDLESLLAASRSNHHGVWDIGLRMLGRLGSRHRSAVSALEQLYVSSRAMLRCRIVTALSDNLPREFCVKMAKRGLNDNAKSVRVGAGQTCLRLSLAELVAEMERVAQNESCPKAKLDMQCSIGLLRDGFFLWPRPDGTHSFMVRISDGVPLHIVHLCPPWCPEPIFDMEEARPYADEFRRVRGQTRSPFRWDTHPA